MHHRVMGPPAVSYAARRTGCLGLVLLGLWLPGLVLAVAAFTSGGVRWSTAYFTLLAALLVLSTFCLGAFWRTQRERVLRWDGRQWTLDDPATKSPSANLRRVEVRLDLQAFMLLRCVGPNAWDATWLWAERGRQSERWHLLRCALYHLLPAESDELLTEGRVGAA